MLQTRHLPFLKVFESGMLCRWSWRTHAPGIFCTPGRGCAERSSGVAGRAGLGASWKGQGREVFPHLRLPVSTECSMPASLALRGISLRVNVIVGIFQGLVPPQGSLTCFSILGEVFSRNLSLQKKSQEQRPGAGKVAPLGTNNCSTVLRRAGLPGRVGRHCPCFEVARE